MRGERPRRVPTLEENVNRALESVGDKVIVSLEAIGEAVEKGLITIGDGVIAAATPRPARDYVQDRRRVQPVPSGPEILRNVEPAGLYLAAKGLAVAGGVALAMMQDAKTEHAASVEKEHAADEAAIEKRIDDAHAAAAAELRADDAMKKEFTPEQIDAAADALEMYDSKKVFAVIAKHSGLPSWEVARYNSVDHVLVVSRETLDGEMDKDLSGRSVTDPARREWEKDVLRENAGMEVGGYLYINLSHIIKKGATSDSVRSKTIDVLTHENMHGFPSYVTSEQARKQEGLNQFYEGTNELLENIVVHELHGDNNAYSGYMDGAAAAAAVAYESLSKAEQLVVWASHVHGDIDAYRSAYDAYFGKEAFNGMIDGKDLYIGSHAEKWIKEAHITGYSESDLREEYARIAPLDRALENVGDRWPEVAQRANSHLGTGLIVPVRGENINGVLLVSSKSKNELTGGMLRFDGSKGRRIVLLSGWPNGFLVLPGTNVAYLDVDLDAYSLSRKDLEQQSFEERGAAVVKMLRPYRKQLLHFREM